MEIQKQLDKEGYVILRNFFPTRDINQLRYNAHLIFDYQFKHFGYRDRFQNNMIRLFNEHEEVFKNCGKLIQTGEPMLYKLSINDLLIDTLKQLGLKHPNMCTRPVLYFNHPKLAKESVYYKSPQHQDWPSIESSLNSLVIWVPLVDVGLGNGSIILYPGSHNKGILPFKTNGGFAEVEYNDENAIQPKLNIGDVVIFSTLLVHESGEIFDDSIRWSASFRYTDMLEHNFIERGYPNPYIYKPITKQ
jgi:ectoine hydroxylase-related dioxygenase (phytanoyl-CoA dioxygenase family)